MECTFQGQRGSEEPQIAWAQVVGQPAVITSQLCPPTDLRMFLGMEASPWRVIAHSTYYR